MDLFFVFVFGPCRAGEGFLTDQKAPRKKSLGGYEWKFNVSPPFDIGPVIFPQAPFLPLIGR